MAITPDQLKNEILKQLEEFDYNIQWDLSAAAKKRTLEGVKMLRKSYATHRTGDYNKGWRMKKTDKGHVIYNAKKPYLTHLLEKGHLKSNGVDSVDPIPHISIVEKQVVSNFEKDVERIIRERGAR